MFEQYIPDIFEKTVYEIDFKKYYNLGFRAIIFDIDNTLVLHDAECNEQCKKLIDDLKQIGFKIMVLSNNHLVRTKTFCDILNIDYIYDANKPFVKNYLKAIEILDIKKEECLFIGDQLLTDIRGAKKAGIKSILVRPIGKEKYFHIKIKRYIEKIILFINNKNIKKINIEKKIDFNEKAKICFIANFVNEDEYYLKIKQFASDKNCDIIELRIDTIYEKEKSIDRIFKIINRADEIIKKYKKYSLATLRTKQDGSNCDVGKDTYYEIIKKLYSDTKVDIIDIEYRYYLRLKKQIEQIKTNEKIALLSFHEFEEQWTIKKTKKLLKQMIKQGLDIVKIAIFTNKKQEVFDLMEEAKKIEKNAKKTIFFVIIAMGKIGLVSRIFNEYTNTKIIYIDNSIKGIGPIGNINIEKYYELRKTITELI